MKKDIPIWAETLYSKFKANVAQQFLLYGNIDDYVASGKEYLILNNFLASFLSTWQRKWDSVIFYNCSSGLRFADDGNPSANMRELFYNTLGRPQPNELEEKTRQLGIPSNRKPLDKEPTIVLPLLEKILENKNLKTAVIIEYAEALAPNGELAMLLPEKVEAIVTFQRWALSSAINQNGNLIILLAEKLFDIHPDVRSLTTKTEIIEIPFPKMLDREKFINFYLAYRHHKVKVGDFPIAKVTTGFNFLFLEDLWLRASENKHPITLEIVRERKQEIQKAESSDLLNIIEPDEDFDDIGGLEAVKEEFYLLAERMREQDPTMPSGGLLLGPPGTGKSVLAKALAKAVDIPLIQLMDIQEKWVGSSERNMRRALESIKRYDQAIVFIDEFDQAYGGRGGVGDSGVTSRLFGLLLEFMGDTKNRGKVFWLGATNRPDRIDPAMKRPGRFSRQYLLFPPDAADRAKIFKVMFERRLKIPHNINNFSEPVEKTDGLTGAEIEEICNRSLDFTKRDRRKIVMLEDLKAALEDFVPARDPSYELMTMLAVRVCNSKRLIPEKYRDLSADQLDQKIINLKTRLGMSMPNVWGI